MSELVVLLPPSEGKAAGGDGPAYDPGAAGMFAAVEPHRACVRKALRSRAFAAVELGVGPAATLSAMVTNRAVAESPTLPALRRYTGVLYDALDFPGQPLALRRRLARDVVIVSGLFGLLGGDDAIPDYKLPIGARVPRLGRLAAWWRPRLATALVDRVQGAVVWDLLPAAYAAARPPLSGATAHWTVRVLRDRDGVRSVVGHDNKAVKGALARHLIESAATGPQDLAGWTGPGGYQLGEVVPGEAGGAITLVAWG